MADKVTADVSLSSPILYGGDYAFAQLGEHSVKIDRNTGETWVLRYSYANKQASWVRVEDK